MSWDAIVVGSGFGGAVSAARLAERGFRILVLERGPWWAQGGGEALAADRRDLPRGPLGIRKLLRGLRDARQGRRRERLFHADGLLEIHRFDHLDAITASGVGGGSHVYTALLEEPPPDFYDALPAELTPDELRPHFARARAVMSPRPLPRATAKERRFEQALIEAGLPEADYPPMAVDWDAPRGEGPPPGHRGDALVGCEDGSKRTLDRTYIPLAIAQGAELRPLCEVKAITDDASGYAIVYLDHRDGRQRRVAAPRVILAAGGLNTQRLLFDARSGHGGLPRLSASLGRRFSPNADFGILLLGAARAASSSYGPSIAAISRLAEPPAPFVVGAAGLPLHALPLPASLRRVLDRSLVLFAMGRDASRGVMAFDGEGLVSDVSRAMDPPIFDAIEATLRRLAEPYAPRRLRRRARGDRGLLTVHPLGGCSMGRHAEEGVTDHRGQVFGHPGLFVADGSLYPRAPGVPPSLTIAALAERQAALME